MQVACVFGSGEVIRTYEEFEAWCVWINDLPLKQHQKRVDHGYIKTLYVLVHRRFCNVMNSPQRVASALSVTREGNDAS